MDSAPKRAPTEREQFEAERAMTDPTTLQRQKRSEYVTCVIDRSNQERPLTWCRNLRSSTTFYFIDIDHAAFIGRADSRELHETVPEPRAVDSQIGERRDGC